MSACENGRQWQHAWRTFEAIVDAELEPSVISALQRHAVRLRPDFVPIRFVSRKKIYRTLNMGFVLTKPEDTMGVQKLLGVQKSELWALHTESLTSGWASQVCQGGR